MSPSSKLVVPSLRASKPQASLSLDLDDKWTYMKTHGNPQWKEYPTYLHTIIPRVLRFLKERALTATFFVVGQDAVFQRNQKLLHSIADAGHEIGNHSFHHEPWLHLYGREQLEDEITSAHQVIEAATGKAATGFRGPGFSMSQVLIETLVMRDYRYDGSSLPTFLGPLARLYYFLNADLNRQQKEERSLLFGTLKDGLRRLKPYVWETDRGSLLEIPVTTIPLLRTPFHLSYLLYLSSHSLPASDTYLRLALTLCRLRRVQPSFLLHPLDFASAEDAPELAFFPAMQLSLEHKLTVADRAIRRLQEHFHLCTMSEHATGCLTSLSERAAVGVSRESRVD